MVALPLTWSRRRRSCARCGHRWSSWWSAAGVRFRSSR